VLPPEALSAQVSFVAQSRTFESLDARATLSLSVPGALHHGEVAMWREFDLAIGGDHRSVVFDDDLADRQILDVGFLYPFSCDSTLLALPLVGGHDEHGHPKQSVIVIDLARMSAVHRVDVKQVDGVVWRPDDTNDLAIYTDEGLIVLRAAGGREVMPWHHPYSSSFFDGIWFAPWASFCAWTPSCRSFAVLDQKEPVSRLGFYNSETLVKVATELLDPAALLPYDEVGFRALAQGRSLVHRSDGQDSSYGGEFVTGDLMPNWLDAVYDQRTTTLSLSTFRPVGERWPSPEEAGVLAVPKAMQTKGKFSSRIDRQLTTERSLPIYKAWVRITLAD